MNGGLFVRLLAWVVALTLLALPVVGVLNGWFASERWPLTRLAVRAEFNHVTAEQIRAAVQPQLGAGFFAIKLDVLRAAVAKLPWVEHVEVRKRWPDTLDVIVFEQQPYARWGDDRLVNRQGEIFSVADVEGLKGLPRLAGPDERIVEVLEFYAECMREFSGSGLVIDRLKLSPRGGWSIDLASGGVIEIGRENASAHLDRFLDVWPRLVGSQPGAPAYIDLRYENGFAIRWAPLAPETGPLVPAPAPAAGGSETAPPGKPADPPVGETLAAAFIPSADSASRSRTAFTPESPIPVLP